MNQLKYLRLWVLEDLFDDDWQLVVELIIESEEKRKRTRIGPDFEEQQSESGIF